MSFYGSTYFQLIDTFYKILVKNSGGSAVAFPPSLDANTQASQASGRKGVLEFGTGNRWIYASQDPVNSNSYTFWHTSPDTNLDNLTQVEFKGGKNQVTVPAGATVVTLEPDTYIKAPVFKFDKAGHISAADHVYYKMPVSETEKAIEELQNKVGEPEEGETETLFEMAYDADQRIKSLRSEHDEIRDELGDYSKVFPNSKIYQTDQGVENIRKDFYAAFGSMDALRTAMFGEEESSKTLVDSILALNSAASGLSATLINLTGDINDLEKDSIQFEQDIAALKAKDLALDATDTSLQAQITSNKTSADSQISAERDRATAEETRIAGLVNTETKRAKDEEVRIVGLIEAETERAEKEEAQLKGLINNGNSAIEALGKTVSDYKSALDATDDSLSKRITALEDDRVITEELNEVIATVEENKRLAEEGDNALVDRILALEENSATAEDLSAIDAIVSQHTTDIGALGTRIDDTNKSIGDVNTDLTNSITTLGGRIDTLSGTIATHGNTLASKADDSRVTLLATQIESKADDNRVALLEAQVTTNQTTVEAALATKADNSTVATLQTEIDQLPAKLDKKANQTELNTLTDLVHTMASQESLNDVAAAVDTKAGVDALEKFMRIVDEQFTKLQAENEGLHASITELTARIEALENPITE